MLEKHISAKAKFSENTATISKQCVDELGSIPVPMNTLFLLSPALSSQHSHRIGQEGNFKPVLAQK